MQRRTVLRALAGLATLTTPAFTTEGPRFDTGADEWESIAATYATLYYALPPAELINRLSAEMAALEHKAAGKDQTSLCRVAAQLSAVMALALVASHRLPLARRWWVTAHRYADQSGDLDTRLWVSDWEVVSGTYERRPTSQIIDLADQTISLADQAITLGGDHVCCGSVGIWSGRAQALALAGNTKEAISALHMTADVAERMPAAVMANAGSLFGWHEVRLRHTESYVYTHLGLTDQAMAAQDRALAIYPTELSRERALLELHRAKCHILRGDIGDGLTYAADVLDDLPADQHNASLYEIGRHVIRAVPSNERRRAEYGELRERLLTLRASLDPR